LYHPVHTHSHVCLRCDAEVAAAGGVDSAGALPILTRLRAGAALHTALAVNSFAAAVWDVQVAADAVAAREALPALATAGVGGWGLQATAAASAHCLDMSVQ
jgi:hypothetical protein